MIINKQQKQSMSASCHAQRGAALIEWIIVGPLALFLLMATIEIGFWMMAKSALNYATFEAARSGAVEHADLARIKTAFEKAMVPFYGGGLNADEINQTYATVVIPDIRASLSTLEIVNPTHAVFDDFGVTEAGRHQIPNDNLAYRANFVGSKSAQSIQDANLLKIKVVYGYKLKIPLVRAIIFELLKIITVDEQTLLMYGTNRIPIQTQAIVRMQSAAYDQPNWKTGYGFM
ncbi:MAG: TadE/TadG family type IV pilus assembly protein [Pseudomonadota bacterium]